MIQHPRVAIAVVGVGAILPDAPTAAQFWENVRNGRYSISDVDPARWDPDLYYDPDPHAVDRTYSRIGGWVRDFEWNPLGWRLPVPPRVGEQMDDGQKWAINCARAALVDYGWPERPIDTDRTAVILGNALAGEKHYRTHLRVSFPEFARELERAPHFAALPAEVRAAIESEARDALWQDYQGITEDTMPGELANVIAGRVANLFDLHGPNYVCDAACASAMAAMNAGISGLVDGDFDAVLTGGIDRNMNAAAYVKFCKIGALSATGTRPYGEGADGFVMGEGAALFLLRRLADAERDGDRIYAVIRGMAGSSDGRGKGITAPNPVGQRLAMERAWSIAGLSPATATLVEGHGTSTRVGDVVEVESLARVFGDAGAAPGSIALGSVKSNIGHLKGAAGAAGMLKTVLALHDRVLPPSLHAVTPNPDVDFEQTPFTVNHELCEWRTPGGDGVRRAGVSAFGFGGTNFHAVLEEHVPGRLNGGATRSFAVGAGVSQSAPAPATPAAAPPAAPAPRSPLRGALLVGAHDIVSLAARLAAVEREARAGTAPPPAPPAAADLRAPERVAIDYGDAAELAERAAAVQRALALEASGTAAPMWKALRARGVFRGQGPAARVAFLYPGQGSQYANMLATLRAADPIVAETFDEADQIMIPLLGRPLSDVIFVDPGDGDALARAEQALRETEITQPAVMAVDLALTRLLAAYGIAPDMAMGHSLGEYAALMTAGSLTFEHTMEAVSARGREMSSLTLEDRGLMAAVFAPLGEVEAAVAGVDGCVVANVNSNSQAVIGGATAAVTAVMETLSAAGHTVVPLPVSHAFHTSIVAPASVPLRAALTRLGLRPPQMPVVANVTGELYPTGDGAAGATLDLLAGQVASPVQFVAGLRTLYREGARVFVEVGPKRALAGFADDVLGADPEVVSLITNHPKVGDIVSFNQALCGLWAAGLGIGVEDAAPAITTQPPPVAAADEREPEATMPQDPTPQDHLRPGGDRVDQPVAGARKQGPASAPAPAALEPVVITGASLGLPGRERIFDDGNVAAALRGEQGIDVVPTRFRQAMLDKHITRLVKRERGDPTFEVIDDPGEVIKLAARGGALDVVEEFGISAERRAALDRTTELAIGAGIDALRDAGIPLVLRYRTTTTGTLLPDRHLLPESMRDDTGIVFASAFPGGDALIGALNAYHEDRARREQLEQLRSLRPRMEEGGADAVALTELDRRIRDLERAIEADPYRFDRRFLFRVLSMGHSQLAELIGARGPNTQVNSACASTTQAIAVAEDWIRAGRCRRVIVVAADDVTSDNMLEWVGAGFLASGAAATDDVVAEAALPFDRRRHGMLLGMGAAALVVESAEAARERAITPICEVLGVITANSAFHGTRLDVAHISRLMETLVAGVERRAGLDRMEMASELVFVSHETYTPARGGSAAAEVEALRAVFGDAAGSIVVANTKGFTGHAMGVGIEDVAAVKALETGIVPPVPNFREVDPELGELRLSRGGAYPVRYALRLAAGFGSQISMSVLRWVPAADGVRRAPDQLGYAYRIADRLAWTGWLNRIGGRPDTELEVVKRTLRVHDEAPAHPVRTPEPQRVEPRSAAAPVAPGNRHAPAAPAPAPAAETATAVAMPESPTPAATAVAAPPVVEEAAIRERVLALVAEKTGYPQDMLDLDLDLEADLGVDTVKQAELFAVIREHYGIPRDDSLRLRDVPTLAHIIRFVVDRIPGGAVVATAAPPAVETAVVAAPAPAAPAPVAAAAPGVPAVDESAIREHVLALVAEKTGYPQDMLDLDLDLEADLGVDTVKQAELFAVIREDHGIPRDDSLRLRDVPTLAHIIRFVVDRIPGGAVVATAAPPAVETAVVAAPAPAAPAPVAAAAPAVPAVDVESAIREHVLALVAEKTGYPQDMLDLDLDLEADLGVDTVKQAELFAVIREHYGIPRDDSLRLRDVPTLAHIIRFVVDRIPGGDGGGGGGGRGGGAPAPASAPAETPVEASPLRAGALDFGAADSVPRRVPVAIPRPALELCAATGVSLGAGSRVIVAGDEGGVAAALAGRLRALGALPLFVDTAADAAALTAAVEALAAEGPVQGVHWLPGLDVEPPLAGLDLAGWREGLRRRVKLLHATMRAVGGIEAAGTFLVSATRLGGRHGYDDAGATAPMGGAVTGFTKAFARERPAVLVKAVDHDSGADPDTVAEHLVAETLRDPGAVEVGHALGARWTVGLEERPAADGGAGMRLGPGSVVVVTGAAGGIVSAIVADLAAATGATFHLLDLTPAPARDDPDPPRVATDREGLKRDLVARMREGGERVTPVMVDRRLAALERQAAALDAVTAVEAAGGEAHYHAVDLTDTAAVARVVDAVRTRHGRIDVLLHAAGLEVSRLLPDKAPAEFDLVFDVKSDGLHTLLGAAGDMPLGAVVVFSSVAGRFGNGGQTDYSAANDLLCKVMSSMRTTRPATRAIAVDWTAWGGIGMATRGSVPKMMELAGIDMLPPQAGIPTVRRELLAGATRGEIVVGGRLGILVEERAPRGGAGDHPFTGAGPMVERLAACGVWGPLVTDVTLDPARHRFLDDHRIEGTPVLPGVMSIEAFVETSRLALPGWHVVAVEDVDFSAPFKIYRDQPRTATVEVRFARGASDVEEIVARCTLLGSRTLAGHDQPQTTVHARGRVRLRRTPLEPGAATPCGEAPATAVGAADLYRVYFHGPGYRVLDAAWREGDAVVGRLATGLPDAAVGTLHAPLLAELCFQAAGVRELGSDGVLALPAHVDAVSVVLPTGAPTAPVHAVTRRRDGGVDAEVVDARGTVLLRMRGYRTTPLPLPLGDDLLAPFRRAMA